MNKAAAGTKDLIADGSSLKIDFRSFRDKGWQETHPQVCGRLLVPPKHVEQCFNTSMELPTQAGLLHVGSFLPGFSGPV
jgi:hypothetical protein